MTCAIDFETYYDDKYSLSKMHPWDYVQDSRFDAYLVSIHGEGLNFVGPPQEFDWQQLNGCDLVAHNMAFDGLVRRRLVALGIIPDIKCREFCTADMAVYLGLPRNLAGVMQQRYNTRMSKAVRSDMKGKTLSDTVKDGSYQDLIGYADFDAKACYQFWADDNHLWPDWEKEASRINRESCWSGVMIDRETVDNSLAELIKLRDRAIAILPWSDEDKPSSLPALTRYLRSKNVKPPNSYNKLSPEMQRLLVDTKDMPEIAEVLQARLDVASLNPHIARLNTMQSTADENNVLRFSLKYGGTHTLRNSSGDDENKGSVSIFNPLNLPKEPVFGVDLRGTLIPRPGHKFVIYDYSQIEARVILWLAGHTAMLDHIAKYGGNLYISYAVLIGWAKPEDVDTPEKVLAWKHSYKYALIKAVVLAHGFGMGHRRFRDQSEQTSHGKINLTLEEADKLTTEWRQNNQPVCQLWSRLGQDFERAVAMRTDKYSIVMPSGRVKNYWNPHVKILIEKLVDEETGKPYTRSRRQLYGQVTKGGYSMPVWGGILAQHVTQATARDIMTESAVYVSLAHPQWPWLWSCYDEVVFEVPEVDVAEACQVIPEELCNGKVAQTWAKGLPLAVEGGVFDRYTK